MVMADLTGCSSEAGRHHEVWLPLLAAALSLQQGHKFFFLAVFLVPVILYNICLNWITFIRP